MNAQYVVFEVNEECTYLYMYLSPYINLNALFYEKCFIFDILFRHVLCVRLIPLVASELFKPFSVQLLPLIKWTAESKILSYYYANKFSLPTISLLEPPKVLICKENVLFSFRFLQTFYPKTLIEMVIYIFLKSVNYNQDWNVEDSYVS